MSEHRDARAMSTSPSAAPRVLFVEVAYGALGADYSVHSQLVETLAPTGDLAVLSLSHPDLAAARPDDDYRFPCRAYDFGDSAIRRRASVVVDLPGAVRAALPAIRDFGPDVIYSSQLRRDALTAHLIGAITRRPHITHLHYVFGPWLGRAAVQTIRRARHVIAVSEYVRQTLLMRGIPEDRVSTVPNLTNPPSAIDRDRATVRRELGIDDDEIVLIAVGRLDHGKRFPEMMEAVARARDRHENLRVLVCGSSLRTPGHDLEIKEQVHRLGLDDVVQFLGHRSDIPALMNASDVFCLPATMEGFGLVYIEAMRAGLPVIAVRSGGVPEIVVDGLTGLLSYPGDRAQLADNIDALVADEKLREQMGVAGRARLATHFDNETISRRWLDIVTSALGQD